MQLSLQSNDYDIIASLSERWRDEVRRWWSTLQHVESGTLSKREACALMHASRPTLERKLAAARSHGITGLIPAYKAPVSLSPEFVNYWKSLCESYQRRTRPAYRELLRRWQRRDPIPGYIGHPGWPNLPRGWDERTLYRYQPSKLELSAMRHGLGRAVAKHAPKVLTTRVGTWHLSHVVWDDVWLDSMAHMLQQQQLVRVLQLGALDLHSGCRFHWGTRPQIRDEETGRKNSLKESDMRFALAAQLHQFGISPRGTTYVVEHGTAAIRQRVRDVLTTAYPDLITISDSGMTGDIQALAGLHEGRGGGNFRHKAALESLHNLIHNELAALPAQTGHDRDEPEFLHGLRREHEQLWKIARALPAEMSRMLKYPAFEYHSEFIPLVNSILATINHRTDHDLEGWSKLGYIIREYRLSADSDAWTPEHDMPVAMLPAMRGLIQHNPELVRVRKLSPAEVFARHKMQPESSLKVPDSLIADILYQDLAHPRKCRNGMFAFEDIELSPEPMHYESRVTTPDGRQQELKDGETYELIVNPFDTRQAWVYAGRTRAGAFLGVAAQLQAISKVDVEAIHRAHGRSKARLSDLLAETRQRNTHITAAANARHRHNAAVIKSALAAKQDATQRGTAALDAGLSEDPNNEPRTASHEIDPATTW